MTPIEKAKEALEDVRECGLLERFPRIGNKVLNALDALDAPEAENPEDTGTARLVAQSIIGMALADYSGLERQLENDTLISIEWIQQYAVSYHAKKCAECKATEAKR